MSAEPTPRELERRAEDEWLAAQRELAGLPEYDQHWVQMEAIGGPDWVVVTMWVCIVVGLAVVAVGGLVWGWAI